MNQKKNRLEQAKIARAYVRGGTPPYQAARKCGFMRVSLMEEAIRELEAQEKPENAPSADPAPVSNDGTYLPKAAVVIDTRPPAQPEPVHAKPVFYTQAPAAPKPVIYKPLRVFKNDVASVAYYGQNGDKAPMFKLSVEGTNAFLIISETNIKAVVNLLCEAAGLNGPESTGINDQKILVGAEKEEESVLLARIKELEVELHAEREAHKALKLKVFDKLLAQL